MSNVAPINHADDEVEKPKNEGIEAESIWDESTLQAVVDFSNKLDEIQLQREELNASKAAAQAQLVNMGFNADALKAAISYAKTPEDKRQNFDLSYQYARRALGCPVQDDLFIAAMQQQVKVQKPAE